MAPNYLVTHSGGFHADELFSSVILTRLFPEAEIVRSRKPDWITPSEDRIIYDVGGQYSPKMRIFDHHQRNAPQREDGKPFSSFGLIWKHFGNDYLVDLGIAETHVEQVHASFESSFVIPIDLLDNGALSPAIAGPLAGMTLPTLLESLKPVFDKSSPKAEDAAFESALMIARAFAEARVAKIAAKLRAESIVETAIKAAGESAILELPMGMPYLPTVTKMGAEHLLFVINPRGEDWSIGGIRKNKDGFKLRANLPETWAGLTNQDLEKACGVDGATFCHNGLFVAAAKTRAAILDMANLAVKEAQKPAS